MELLLDLAGGRGDVDPVDIGDEVHDAEHRQHDMGGLEPKPHFVPSRVCFVYCFNGRAGRQGRLRPRQVLTTFRCDGEFDWVGASSDFIAASTPPARCGTPAAARPISTPDRAPINVSSLHSPRWPMRNTLPASLLRPEPSDML